ncbi:uncharacterized protein LOC126723288 [Quercus robur]|uniref:uncharacterized protein LOC126723288 n=1 Tax=Quercus robur TaxID=38942 RepID=UPI002162FB9A|nr:uncharacterized protein LOC126723288 [Quercus robur]
MERVPDHCPRVQIWNPPLELDRTPLLLDSSIKDFQKGKTSYVANALEQPQLLPQDMADLRTLKKHEVFLTLKRDLAMVIQTMHIPKEWVDNTHKQMKEKEVRCVATVEAFTVAEQRIKDLNVKLTKANMDKKSAKAALVGAERQAEDQRQHLRRVRD